MWNSNSLVAWLLACSGQDTASIGPPANGRAPGWHAGLVVAARREGHASAAKRRDAGSWSPASAARDAAQAGAQENHHDDDLGQNAESQQRRQQRDSARLHEHA